MLDGRQANAEPHRVIGFARQAVAENAMVPATILPFNEARTADRTFFAITGETAPSCFDKSSYQQ